MTAVSPRNPNLCLSCEQLVEDDSAELDRLLSAVDHVEIKDRCESGTGAEEVSHEVAGCARPVFVTLA
jgi:hypothetical protein